MSLDRESALDNLAGFIQAISEDGKLRGRFSGMAKMTSAERFNQIQFMAHEMSAERLDPDLIASFRLLADERVFEAAKAALRDCGCAIE
jgi:hypothetical protein